MTGCPRQFRLPLVLLGCVLALALRAEAAPRDASAIPDLTKVEIKDAAQLPDTPALSWNLGPTGARGWMYGADGNRGPLGSQILVTAVERSSPADGVLRKFDVLLGANGRPFTRDARRGLGQAITESETAARGPLWGTGGMALAYALSEPRLRILGAALGRPPDRALVARSIELTLAAIKADIDAGDIYRAKCRVEALTPILPAGDRRCAAWLKMLADPASEPGLAAGQKFYDVRALAKTDDTCFAERFTFDRRARGIMTSVSRDGSAGAYQAMAARLLQANPLP